MWLGWRGIVDMTSLFGVCGFKQSHGLPCPGCGFTKSAIAFAGGRLFDSFYIQPASAVFCCGLVAAGIFSLLAAVFGIKFSFLDRPASVILKYIAVSAIIIIAGGWAVTLSRAMAAKSG